MQLKALITTLVLGSTSIAAAAPVVRDHRTQITYHRPLTPVLLANNARLDGRTVIKVSPSQRAFRKLELRAQNGRTQIDKLIISFGNGRSQVVDINARLSKQLPSVSVDLTGEMRNVERILVVGKTNGWFASVDVLAI